MKNYELEVPISNDNEALVKENNKCITCGYCKKVCTNDITVARMFEIKPNCEPICVNCGQCANICPTEAIHERFDYLSVKKILKDKKDKTIIFNIAPAVRVALGEEYNLIPGTNLESKIPTALKKLGADYVFDITFGADLTIMEEATELVDRIKNNKKLPQFTSCCPAWVKYCEIFYPKLIPNLSSVKSPITMQSTIIKTYFANKINVKPDDIINIVIAPCTAKKAEIKRKKINYTSWDTNFVLTTRELALLLKESNISITKLKASEYDSPLKTGSGAGVIFGSTGGVCEAALRTAYFLLTNKNLKKEELVFNEIRGMSDIKEASIKINDRVIKVAVCNGMRSATELIDKLLKKEVSYDFIEVMNCPGGCIAGGGQPKITLLNMKETRISRMNSLYEEDNNMPLRLCHENPEIISIYKEFLEYPNSKIAKKLLHTKYYDKSDLLGGTKNDKC